MKRYPYDVSPIKYVFVMALCPAYVLGIVVAVALGISLYMLILYCSSVGLFFLLLCLWWYREIRPDILGEVIIDEEKHKLKIYRPEKESSEFDISDIEEVRYNITGGLYIRTKRRKQIYHIRIISSKENEFEREIQTLGKKYGFSVVVLWKRRDVETGKRLSEIVKEDLERSSRREK